MSVFLQDSMYVIEVWMKKADAGKWWREEDWADRDVGDAVPYGKTEKISANRDVGDAVPYGKIEKILADRDVSTS